MTRWALIDNVLCYWYFEKYGRLQANSPELQELKLILDKLPHRYYLDAISNESIAMKLGNFESIEGGRLNRISQEARRVYDSFANRNNEFFWSFLQGFLNEIAGISDIVGLKAAGEKLIKFENLIRWILKNSNRNF